MKNTTTYIKLLSISIILMLFSCDEKNDPVKVVDKKDTTDIIDTVIVEECLEREKNHFGLVYRPAVIGGLVKSGDNLFFHAGGRLFRYSLTTKQYETIELNFDPKFDYTYIIQEFDMCPYDPDRMVIYVTMYAPGLDRLHQVVTYNWKEKTGKIEEIKGFEEIEGILYFTNINWLAKSSENKNYMFFSPGSAIKNNIEYFLENDTFDTLSDDLKFRVSNNHFEFKHELNSLKGINKNYINDILVDISKIKHQNGIIFSRNLNYMANVIQGDVDLIFEIYQFNNYQVGEKITELDIYEEHCLYANRTSFIFLDDEHYAFAALKEQSKFEGNRNIFDLYIYNFKTETLVDTIIFRQ